MGFSIAVATGYHPGRQNYQTTRCNRYLFEGLATVHVMNLVKSWGNWERNERERALSGWFMNCHPMFVREDKLDEIFQKFITSNRREKGTRLLFVIGP